MRQLRFPSMRLISSWHGSPSGSARRHLSRKNGCVRFCGRRFWLGEGAPYSHCCDTSNRQHISCPTGGGWCWTRSAKSFLRSTASAIAIRGIVGCRLPSARHASSGGSGDGGPKLQARAHTSAGSWRECRLTTTNSNHCLRGWYHPTWRKYRRPYDRCGIAPKRSGGPCGK